MPFRPKGPKVDASLHIPGVTDVPVDDSEQWRWLQIAGVGRHIAYCVPSGGFSADLGEGDAMYIFYTTDVDAQGSNIHMNRAVVAKSTDDGMTWTKVLDVPKNGDKIRYVYPVVADRRTWPGLPFERTLLMFASGVYYRTSPMYLACAPLDADFEGDTEKRRWLYLTGIGPQGPTWSSNEYEAQPLFHQPRLVDVPTWIEPGWGEVGGGHWEYKGDSVWVPGGIGEMSVAYNPFLRKWLMLYNFNKPEPGIHCRASNTPWGPWERVGRVFNPDDDEGWGRFLHDPKRGDPNNDDLQDGDPARYGATYAPGLIPEMFKGGGAHESVVYFTMSTWNPYQVLLMRTRLRRASAWF